MEFDEPLLFKVTIRKSTADEAIGAMFPDNILILSERVSPIVVYIRMTGREAVEYMAQNSDLHIVRANEDWSI